MQKLMKEHLPNGVVNYSIAQPIPSATTGFKKKQYVGKA
jgi:hypothetical protein